MKYESNHLISRLAALFLTVLMLTASLLLFSSCSIKVPDGSGKTTEQTESGVTLPDVSTTKAGDRADDSSGGSKSSSESIDPSSESITPSAGDEKTSEDNDTASDESEHSSDENEQTSGEEDTEPVTYNLRESGVSFTFPEALTDLNGILVPSYGMQLNDSGIFLSGLTYYAIPEDKYLELLDKGDDLTQEDQLYIQSHFMDMIEIFTIGGNGSLEDLNTGLASFGLTAEGFEKLGSAGEYNFYCLVDPQKDAVGTAITLDETFQKEYESIRASFQDLSWISLYEPVSASTADEGTKVSFDTLDLDGNPVNSEELFKNNIITMVNIWGTFCGPCINEMPDLQTLNQRITEKGCTVVGIVCDVQGIADTGQIQAAKDILEDTGVTYLNLLPWNGFDTAFPAQFIPTTYFVDSKGQIVGEAAVGSRGAEAYEALLDEVLERIRE